MLVIKNAFKITHDQIQNWMVTDIDLDSENYTIELSRYHGNNVIDVIIKVSREKNGLGMYFVTAQSPITDNLAYSAWFTKSDIANRNQFRSVIYYNILKKIDECLQ